MYAYNRHDVQPWMVHLHVFKFHYQAYYHAFVTHGEKHNCSPHLHEYILTYDGRSYILFSTCVLAFTVSHSSAAEEITPLPSTVRDVKSDIIMGSTCGSEGEDRKITQDFDGETVWKASSERSNRRRGT